MDTALPQKFPFILDRNLAKANCIGNRVCTSCDIVVLGSWDHGHLFFRDFIHKTLKIFKIKNKENKMSHGRGNTLRNMALLCNIITCRNIQF